MKSQKFIPQNPTERVTKMVYDAMDIFANKVAQGFIRFGLEATFQLHLSKILMDLTEIYTLFSDERFEIVLEHNIPYNDVRKNYVDIVIIYTKLNSNETILYPIELKCKKVTDMAEDLGVLESYKDMYELDVLQNEQGIGKGFFIFLTDHKTYTTQSVRGDVRKNLLMHDGAKIKAGDYFKSTNKSAQKFFAFLPRGFVFSKDHFIEYTNFKSRDMNYWYFIAEFDNKI